MAEPPPPPPRDPADDETVVTSDWVAPEERTVVTTQEVVEEPPRRRLPEIWPWLLALLLAAVGVVLAVFLLQNDDDEESARTTTAALVAVPDVVGRSEEEARRLLEAAGLGVNAENVPSDEPEGTVVAQDPAAGDEVPEGSDVRINVAEEAEEETTAPATTEPPTTTTEPPPTTTEPPPATTQAPPPQPQPATVPDVVGQPLADAARAFGNERLRVSAVYVPSSEPLGTVVAQAQPAGTQRQSGDTVQVNVSRGPDEGPQANVPDVVGRTLDDARAALERARLEVLVIQAGEGESDEVSRQTPQAGTRVPRGALVVLYAGGE